MIIQFLLIAGLLACAAYAFLQRARSRLVSVVIGAASLAGIYFVLFPQATSQLAHLVGVGRGADLVLYCWILISLAVSMNLQFRILSLEETITTLTREIALQRAPRGGVRPAPDDRASAAGS